MRFFRLRILPYLLHSQFVTDIVQVPVDGRHLAKLGGARRRPSSGQRQGFPDDLEARCTRPGCASLPLSRDLSPRPFPEKIELQQRSAKQEGQSGRAS